jgi:hypothetical protein
VGLDIGLDELEPERRLIVRVDDVRDHRLGVDHSDAGDSEMPMFSLSTDPGCPGNRRRSTFRPDGIPSRVAEL